MSSNLEHDFLRIDFEHDPVLNKESDLDNRIQRLFSSDTENGNENQSKDDPKPSASPTQFMASPALSNSSSSAKSSSLTPTLRKTVISKTIQPKSNEPTTATVSAVCTPKLAKWESPDDKIHRYRLRKDAAQIKKKEFTLEFIALKQATRKLDTRNPLPDKATVKILQV